jgi:hypothetical protein
MEPESMDWARAGVAIRDRIRALSLTKSELLRESGMSRETLDSYFAGIPHKRHCPDKLRDLSVALQWTPDSLKRLLEGGEPIEARPADAVVGRFLLEELTRLRVEHDDLRRRIENLPREMSRPARDDTPRTA